MPVYHLDFYRIESSAEVDNLGLEEYFSGEGVAIVEWAEKIESFLPKEYLMIIFEYVDYSGRNVGMSGIGKRYIDMVNKIEMEICETAGCKTV